jgi:hypothetical protein
MAKFQFPFPLKNGSQLDVFAAIRGENLDMKFTYDGNNYMRLVDDAVQARLEWHEIVARAWSVYEERRAAGAA